MVQVDIFAKCGHDTQKPPAERLPGVLFCLGGVSSFCQSSDRSFNGSDGICICSPEAFCPL